MLEEVTLKEPIQNLCNFKYHFIFKRKYRYSEVQWVYYEDYFCTKIAIVKEGRVWGERDFARAVLYINY